MEKLLETYSQPRLNHEEIENPNRPIMSEELELGIKSLPIKKSPGQDSFTSKLYQAFEEE